MPARLREIELDLKPEDVASGLRHLGGLVYFDSSGNIPGSYGEVVSIIAARPAQVLTGHVSDTSELERVLEEHQAANSPLPHGGLCGWLEYEGAYCFGVYQEMLVYRHADGQWLEVGNLSSVIQNESGNAAVRIGEFRSLMSREDYVAKVARIREYIAAGDIYQVNLTQKFEADIEGEGDLFELYLALREKSPAPLASYMDLNGREVLSSSPETFLRISGGVIETRPIKGTRPRHEDPDADLRSAYELRSSEKERAELVMITDLERNDLGQVCKFGSVRVEEMLKLEKLEQVYHLVSTVTGELRDGMSHVEALSACFPGGSITGAPKKRAMEIIDELEREPRGLYTGAMGYFGFGAESQFNIVIRTLVRESGKLHYHVGAGIVADSDPEAEYEETLHKARGMREAVQSFLGS
ncbi:isochorismate synthase MenF [Rubritalea halochordaticola]|uniref:Isochorismate synthase MenF n=2 Tax=Rubritalea halochordaticola TaxID=714537 RepID=A0ABP9V333_9BACT